MSSTTRPRSPKNEKNMTIPTVRTIVWHCAASLPDDTEELKFDYVIRFRGNITVTAERYQVGTVLCVQDKTMKQAWCLAASDGAASAASLKALYGKRWSIECGLRDTKDLRFGMGMGSIHVSTRARRDRLWLIAAFAVMLLTPLGAAGEAHGYDRFLKSNTAKRRTHSLFRQGCMLYELLPTMPEPRLLPLVQKFADMLADLPVFAKTFGAV